MLVRVLAWNILHGGGPERCPAIALTLIESKADIVILSEFRLSRGGQLRAVLHDHGLVHQQVSFKGHRLNGLIIASRFPLERAELVACPSVLEHPQYAPELLDSRQLEVVAMVCNQPIRVTGVHVADDSHPTLKTLQWQYLLNLARHCRQEAHMIIGDFNTARRGEDGARRLLCHAQLGKLASIGYKDVCASRDACDTQQPTWIDQWGHGSRIDAAWVSPGLASCVRGAGYMPEVMKLGLSDHVAVRVDLEVA